MKVLYAYNRHRGGGGADNAAAATIELMGRRGLDVRTFVRNSEDLPDNIIGRVRAFASAIYARRAVKDFTAQLEEFRPDVVHVHEIFPLVSPWILPRCTRRGIPVVMTAVDYRLTCPVVTHMSKGSICTRCAGGGSYWALLKNCRGSIPESLAVSLYTGISRQFRLFTNHVSKFIAPSEFVEHWLTERGGIPADRISTISPVVEIPESTVDPAQGQYVAFAGRFAPEKGVDTLLEAARLSGVPVQLSRNAESRVTIDINGEVPIVVTSEKSELEDFYRNARALVMPSKWFETFGLVGAEAMSYGVPVIASRMGALNCLVEDSVDGLLFEPGNAEDLAAKLRVLWDDKELCRRLGTAARNKAVRMWHEDEHYARHLAAYQEAAAARSIRN